MLDNNAIPGIPKDLYPKIWPPMDYITASRMRETSKENHALCQRFFPEMFTWQERSWKVLELTQKIQILEQELQESKIQSPPIDPTQICLSDFLTPIGGEKNSLQRQKETLTRLIKDHRTLINMADSHPLSRLLGGAKAIMNLQEKTLDLHFSNIRKLTPKDLPHHVMKGIDERSGALYIFVRDQFASFYAIRLKEWKENRIVKFGSKLIHINDTRTFGNNNTEDMMELTMAMTMVTNLKLMQIRQMLLGPVLLDQKLFLEAQKEIDIAKKNLFHNSVESLPLWTIEQVIKHNSVPENEFCFGSACQAHYYQELEQAIQININSEPQNEL